MCLVAFAAFLSACQQPMDEIIDPYYSQPFSPIKFSYTPGSFDVATLTWQKMDRSQSYVVELSRGDSLLFDNIVATYETESTGLVLTGLWGETRYSVRVKSKATQDGQTDSKWNSLAFRTNAENIFYYVRNNDIKATRLTVRWISNSEVTKLEIIPNIANATPVQLELTPEEVAAGEKTVTGLTSATKYSVSLFNGEQRRGRVTTTTKWRPSESDPNVLRLSNGDDLDVATSAADNIGKIIFLPDGFTCGTGTGFVLAGKMTIMGDPDAYMKPTLISTSTGGGSRLFRWSNGLDADEIRFENLILQGGANNQGGVFYATTTGEALVRLDAMRFENCEIYDFGRSFYANRGNRTDSRIGLVSLNNCIAKNIGTIGATVEAQDAGFNPFFHITFNNGGIDNIVVTNSTFQKQYSNFIDARSSGGNLPAKNISIDNCTFYDFITGPASATERYFIETNNNPGINVSIRNVILGKTSADSNRKSRHYRNGVGTVTVTGCYRTNDHYTIVASDFQSGVAEYPNVSATLWTDPENGDFTIKDESFTGRTTAGDPRWW